MLKPRRLNSYIPIYHNVTKARILACSVEMMVHTELPKLAIFLSQLSQFVLWDFLKKIIENLQDSS